MAHTKRHLVFQNGMCFLFFCLVFLLGAQAELSIVTWVKGHIPVQRGQHSLLVSIIVSVTACFVTTYTALAKKVLRQKTKKYNVILQYITR